MKVSKGLIMKGHKFGFELVDHLLGLINRNPEVGKRASRAPQIYAGDSQEILSKDLGATVKVFDSVTKNNFQST